MWVRRCCKILYGVAIVSRSVREAKEAQELEEKEKIRRAGLTDEQREAENQYVHQASCRLVAAATLRSVLSCLTAVRRALVMFRRVVVLLVGAGS